MSPWFGYHMPNYTFPDTPPERLFDRFVELAVAAEGAGFQLLTVMDHFYQIRGVGPETDPMLEAYAVLGAIAGRTRTARLGALVTGVTYRNPAELAKTVTTLDIISGGRAMLGLGAAWNEDEHRGYGIDFPPIGERMDRLDEALTICHAMFTEERASFSGRYYRIDSALNSPKPIAPGGPPILVGGGGEQRTLRIAAKHADMTHWFPLGLDMLKHKTEVLARHCEAIGRDPSTIERTMAAPVLLAATESEAAAVLDRIPPERRPYVTPGTPEQAAEALRPYLDAGFTGFTFNNNVLPTPDSIGLAGELLRLVAQEGSSSAGSSIARN
jgi:F420-dependent oxidoreductase-like protein